MPSDPTAVTASNLRLPWYYLPLIPTRVNECVCVPYRGRWEAGADGDIGGTSGRRFGSVQRHLLYVSYGDDRRVGVDHGLPTVGLALAPILEIF